MVEVIVGLIAGIIILSAIAFFVDLSFKIIWNSLIGGVILWIINLTGILAIKITFIHALIVGVFGVPGIILLAIYLNFIK